MPRILPVPTENAPAAVAGLFAAVKASLGGIPNLFRTLGHSPAALGGYLDFSKALAKGSLAAGLREQIALAVAAANGCHYCAAAHATLGRGAGLSQSDVAAALQGKAAKSSDETAIHFALHVVESRGRVTQDDLSAVRQAGFSDAQIVEIIGVVALNIFTNYTNNVAATEIDFPKVELKAAA